MTLTIRAKARAKRDRKATPCRILVATDGSPASGRAIREAATLAARLRAQLIGVHVTTPFETLPRKGLPDEVTAADVRRLANKVANRFLAVVTRAAAARGVSCRCEVSGDISAARGIMAAARTHRCSYIVMGTHGRRGLRRIVLGSVAQNIITRSTVPVLICR